MSMSQKHTFMLQTQFYMSEKYRSMSQTRVSFSLTDKTCLAPRGKGSGWGASGVYRSYMRFRNC